MAEQTKKHRKGPQKQTKPNASIKDKRWNAVVGGLTMNAPGVRQWKLLQPRPTRECRASALLTKSSTQDRGRTTPQVSGPVGLMCASDRAMTLPSRQDTAAATTSAWQPLLSPRLN